MKPNDYLIAQAKGTRPFLAQVKEVTEEGYVVIPDNLRYREETEATIYKRDVLIRLGPEPKPGKVYGVDVSNIYRKSITHDVWGPIHFFVKLDKEKMKMLRLGLDMTAKKLEKMGLTHYMALFQTEIRAKKGKYAGMYHHEKDGKSRTWYAPEVAADQKAMNSVIFHEYGHVLRFNGLTRVKARARWQRLFQQSIAPVVVSHKYLNNLLDHLLEQSDNGSDASLSSVLKTYIEDDEAGAAALKALQRWMRQVHHISPKEISVLWSAGDKDTLKSLWPKSTVDTSKLAPILTDYATKNVEELFAEAFMHHALGSKLPASIQKLLDKSLSEIRTNGNE